MTEMPYSWSFHQTIQLHKPTHISLDVVSRRTMADMEVKSKNQEESNNI